MQQRSTSSNRSGVWWVLLAVALFMSLVVPAAGVSAQVPANNGGVTFEGDLAYEVVHTTYATGGESAVLHFNAGITGLDVAGDGTVFFAEHHGAIQTLDPETGLTTLLGRVNAATHKCITPECEESEMWESGLHGFALANDFDDTGHLYVSYTVANSSCDIPDNIEGEDNAGCWHLSRFTYDPDGTTDGPLGGEGSIDFDDEFVVLEWPFSRYAPDNPGGRTAAHQSGGITVLPDDTIVIGVGDNTSHTSHSGYGPRDPRPENWYFNGERTSLNPADRRGKLLRVNPDGTVPADNPFVGDIGEYRYGGPVAYDPYVLAEGMRNPYRVASDPVTGAVYSGQVGPDANSDDPALGPLGEEELNVHLRDADCAEPAQTGQCPYAEFNGGFPRCIGPNRPYIQYDYQNGRSLGIPEDCSNFDAPAIWYSVGKDSPWSSELRAGGETIMPLDVYASDADNAIESLQGHLLLFDWGGGWMAKVPVNDDGSLDTRPEVVDRIATGFTGPIAAATAPDGSIYVAELGGYFSVNSRIGRIVPAGDGPITAPAATTSRMSAVHPASLAALVLLVLGAGLRRRRQLV